MNKYEQYHAFYNAADPQRHGRAEMLAQGEVTRRWLRNVSAKAVVVELGCGVGPLRNAHPNYIGLDFSFTALTRFESESKRVNGDMQVLPFANDSLDFTFSWAALEHVPNPEKALAEIERVLKTGGIALLAPAWNVRPWAAKGLPARPYHELPLADKIAKATIPIRNSLLWRGLVALPVRFFREVLLRIGRPVPFDYRRLSPNLTEYIYTDCDALTSMDPHAAIVYYKSRGCLILSHPTLRDRVLARHEPVVIRKN